ncbi:protein MTSS 1-like isoform X1 [Tachysurus ichikawai]
MEAVMEKECSALGGLFQAIINDMKSSYPVWEDFISKAGKLQSQLRMTVMAVAAFLDAFQKVADLATGTRACMKCNNRLMMELPESSAPGPGPRRKRATLTHKNGSAGKDAAGISYTL